VVASHLVFADAEAGRVVSEFLGVEHVGALGVG
jgi:hypothetical protein